MSLKRLSSAKRRKQDITHPLSEFDNPFHLSIYFHQRSVAYWKLTNRHLFYCLWSVVRMAERSKAPDSRGCIIPSHSVEIRVFWSTYVGVGSNPTPDNFLQLFLLLYRWFWPEELYPTKSKLQWMTLTFSQRSLKNKRFQKVPASRIRTSDLRMANCDVSTTVLRSTNWAITGYVEKRSSFTNRQVI